MCSDDEPLNARFPFKSMQWQASVPCPYCEAPKWRACVATPSRVRSKKPHEARIDAAMAAKEAVL